MSTVLGRGGDPKTLNRSNLRFRPTPKNQMAWIEIDSPRFLYFEAYKTYFNERPRLKSVDYQRIDRLGGRQHAAIYLYPTDIFAYFDTILKAQA